MDLVTRAIPNLLKIFPNIQFILSSHSPFLPLGMLNVLGEEFDLIELPSGLPVAPQAFSEFNQALAFLRDTKAANEQLTTLAAEIQTPLILCEGVTDPQYIIAAAEALNRCPWLANANIRAIGSMTANGSRGQGSGALQNGWRHLSQNPDIVTRPVLLIFDNDQPVSNETVGNISRITLPPVSGNPITAGIEAYLSPQSYVDEKFWQERRRLILTARER